MEQVPVGVRPMGMGSAFVGVADDSCAISWNPAGVARVRRYELNMMYTRLFDISTMSYISGIVPASERRAMGIDWTHIGLSDEEIDFAQDEVNFSYSYQPQFFRFSEWLHVPVDFLSLGVNVRYFARNVSYDRNFIGAVSGLGTDIGILITPLPRDTVRIGFAATDVLGLHTGRGIRSGTSVRYDSGASDTVLPASYTIGIAYRPKRNWLIAVDVNDRIHLGAEFSPHSALDIRAGLEKDLHTSVNEVNGRSGSSESPTYSIGGTIRYKWANFHYAYIVPPTLEDTFLFALSLTSDFQKPPVEIEQMQFTNLYPVLQYYYANKPNYTAREIPLDDYAPVLYSDADLDRHYPLELEDNIGRIWLRNVTNKPLSLKVKVYIDDYTSKRGTDVISQLQVKPHQRISVPLRRLAFTNEVLKLTQNQSVEATIEVIDITDESRRKAHTSKSLVIHGRNSIQLDDIAKLAVFISPENKIVRDFSRGVLNQYKTELSKTTINRNLYTAMLLFDALHGIVYALTDPNIPFGSGQIDTILFPHEMLQALASYRAGDDAAQNLGDCDDSTALYCALLESVGIHTALIQQPGHVLMAFDAGGLTLEDAQEFGIPDTLYIAIDGRVWIPIETTLIKDGFAHAWQTATNELQRDFVDSITLQQAWEKYGSVNIPGEWSPQIPAKEHIDEKIKDDLASECMQYFTTSDE